MEGRKERKAGKTRGHGAHIIPPLEQGDGAELPVPSHQPQTQRLDPPACLHVCVFVVFGYKSHVPPLCPSSCLRPATPPSLPLMNYWRFAQ